MRELVKMGVDVHVAAPSGGQHFEEYAKYGITAHDLQTDFSIKQLPKRIVDLRSLATYVEPDIVHSHFVGTTLTMRLALRKYNIPRIFQIPGPLHLEHTLFKSAEIMSADSNDIWVGSCRRTLQYYRDSGVEDGRLYLSYYGTDVEKFYRRTPKKLREDLGISSKTKIVGTVAFMYAPKKYLGQRRGLKGHEDLIDAVKIGLDKGYDLALVIVGGAWQGATDYEEQVRAYAAARLGKRAFLLGYRTDVAELYSEFDVAVHPSHSENVGGAVESLLLEVPTVATRVGGFPDLVQDGTTGWLAEPKNPTDLWRSIALALDDPPHARALTNAGHEKARYLFDVTRTAQEVANIYEITLEKERVRNFYG